MSTTLIPVQLDSLEHYMAQINRFPLLSAQEEREIALRYRRDHDLAAAHQLICANLRFVVKVALEYRNYGLKLLDLVQEGNIGLMKAVKKFDPERGLRLITYAVWWIRACIQSYIIRSWSLVKIGTTQAQKKLFFKLRQTAQAIARRNGDADLAEVARELAVSDAEVEEMTLRLGARDASLDVELVEGEGFTLLDTLADPRADQEQELAERQEGRIRERLAQQALAALNARERRIIEQRLLADEPRTLQELADEFGVSRERIRQLEQNALRRMRHALLPEPA